MTNYNSFSPTDELWIPKVPSHWKTSKIKYVFMERSEKGYPQEVLLVASQNMGVVPKNVYGNRTVEPQKDLHLLKLVKRGDFVISLRSFQGGIELAHYQGIISPAYTVMIPNAQITEGYAKYLFKSSSFIWLLQKCVTGIREGQNVDYGKLKNHKIPLPPHDEQDQIVRFLDWKVSGINKLIWIKRKQIAELEEMKKICINDAVTGKTLTCTDTKDSGFDFIGEIPSPWEVIKLKWLLTTSLQYGANTTGIEFDASLPRYIRITDITIDNKLKETGKLSLPSKDALPYMLEDNDILFARSGATVGKSFIYKKKYGISAFAGYLIRAKIDTNKALPEFVYAITLSKFYELWKNKIFIQATIQNISAEKYNNLPIPLPPIEEQKELVQIINHKVDAIETMIAKIEQYIKELTDLKFCLIADVVTGKIDVRGIEIPEYEFVEEVGIEDADEESDDNDEQEE